jgi:hypothetical protein
MSRLSRRLVLRGLGGLSIALPALEFTHGTAWAQATPNHAKRFIVFFEHGGTITGVGNNGTRKAAIPAGSPGSVAEAWTPLGTTEALQLNAVHEPLRGWESSMLVLSSIDNLASKKQSKYNGGHGISNVTALTHAQVTANAAGDAWSPQGASIDAVLASRLAMRNPVAYPALNLAVSAHNYGTPFYSAPGQATSSESNPQTAFTRLFANLATGTTPDPAIARARALKQSVLDGTIDGYARLRTKVSARDLVAVDAHLSHLRALELQLSAMPTPMVGCTRPTLAGPFGSNLPNVGIAMADIIVAAMRCGLTNVATLNVGDFYNAWMPGAHPAAFNIGHSLHHEARDVPASQFNAWYATILDNRQQRSKFFKRLLEGLAQTPEAGGTMLDHSLLLWTSEFRRGESHNVSNLPIVLAGKAGGALRTGRHVDYNLKSTAANEYQTQSTLGNLFTSVLNLCGYPDTRFGGTFGDFTASSSTIVTKDVSGPLPNLVG